jgi:ribosomal protein L11 methyltransferase
MMTPNGTSPIYAVELRPDPADVPLVEEAVAAAGLVCSSWHSVRDRTASVRIVCEGNAHAARTARSLADFLEPWRDAFEHFLPSPAVITIAYEDWAHSWKKHFHTFRASKRLIVKPSWEDTVGGPGDILLEIDPGMCFGTGYHGTTRACLEFMDELAAELGPVSFLDAGCGSGILSLAAHALGYGPIEAFDHDPDAVQTTCENLAAAGIASIRPVAADAAEFTPSVPIRVAAVNILATVLVQHCKNIAQWVSGDDARSYLLLSGILTEQYDDVRSAYTRQGFVEVRTRTIDEWTSGCFRRT